LTKLKVLQLGLLLAILGFLSYKIAPYFGLSEISTSSISNLILLLIVLVWISSYLLRVLNGNMTFMEQRKRYRQLYEKKFTEKLEKKFESLSNDDQKKLLEELEEK
tara:strand:- start:115 stop:432 length:318 start_codon:yes stop_codon:yes gene_type:complete